MLLVLRVSQCLCLKGYWFLSGGGWLKVTQETCQKVHIKNKHGLWTVMVRCRLILQVFLAPAGIHYDHHACKQREFTCKHKNSKTFEASFNTRSKNYAPQPATLAGQEETPRWLSSIPKIVQSRNCCPAQKFPQNIHCTHTHPSQSPSQNKRCSEARAQSDKQGLSVSPGSSVQHFYTCSSQILTPASKGSLPNTVFTWRESPALQKPTTLSCITKPHSISSQWLLRILSKSATFVCKLSVSFPQKTTVSFC